MSSIFIINDTTENSEKKCYIDKCSTNKKVLLKVLKVFYPKRKFHFLDFPTDTPSIRKFLKKELTYTRFLRLCKLFEDQNQLVDFQVYDAADKKYIVQIKQLEVVSKIK